MCEKRDSCDKDVGEEKKCMAKKKNLCNFEQKAKVVQCMIGIGVCPQWMELEMYRFFLY